MQVLDLPLPSTIVLHIVISTCIMDISSIMAEVDWIIMRLPYQSDLNCRKERDHIH